jgi:hypothetical protein
VTSFRLNTDQSNTIGNNVFLLMCLRIACELSFFGTSDIFSPRSSSEYVLSMDESAVCQLILIGDCVRARTAQLSRAPVHLAVIVDVTIDGGRESMGISVAGTVPIAAHGLQSCTLPLISG